MSMVRLGFDERIAAVLPWGFRKLPIISVAIDAIVRSGNARGSMGDGAYLKQIRVDVD